MIAIQLNKQLKTDFSSENFIAEVLQYFKNKISEEEHAEIVNDIYFTEQKIPVLSPLMYMAKPFKDIDIKTKKSLEIFKQMLQDNETELILKTDLNFVEQDIYKIFNTFIEDKQYTETSSSYVNFLDNLYVGTQQDNIIDKNIKNRGRYGGKSHLTIEQVDEIRLMWNNTKGETVNKFSTKICGLYGVSRTTIYGIVKERTWTYV